MYRFSAVRAVARFTVFSGRLMRDPILVTIAVSAACDDPVARKYSHANHIVPYRMEIRRVNRALCRASSVAFRGKKLRIESAARMLRRIRVDVGCIVTRPTNRRALTPRHREGRRHMTDITRRTRTKPRDWGERWYCAQTANSAAMTVAGPARGRGNVERRKTKIARKVRPPAMKGYAFRNSIGGDPTASERTESRRNTPGQFAEYSPRAPAGMWPVDWIAWASEKCR